MQISIGKLLQLFKYFRGKTKQKPQKKEKNENWINPFFIILYMYRGYFCFAELL